MRAAAALVLALAACQVLAVDVDRIEVRSRRGEPLVADIPVTGASAEDLRALQAQLASPATFARTGLPRPQGVVAGLRFAVVRGARPLIRVTSDQPVQDDFLTFLMQVESPQGRLVREYSIALGAEPTAPALLPPQVDAPVATAPALVQRPPDPAYALAPPVQTPQVQAPQVQAPPEPPPASAIPLAGDRAPPAAPPTPAQAPAARRTTAAQPPIPVAAPARRRVATPTPPTPASVPPAPARSTAAPARPPVPQPGDYRVRPGDTLTAVVERMALPGATQAQAMLAVLRANPDAFAAGNINQLRGGVVLRAPAAAEAARLSPAEAEAVVQRQVEQWRTGTIPPPQVEPSALAPAAVATAPVPVLPAPIPVLPRTTRPRLEIAPEDPAGLAQAGSGRGGAGDAAGAQARAAADALAVRYTEFQQMQQRVADLEQRQKLLLAQNAALAQRPQRGAGTLAWLVAGIAVLVALAAVLWRRRPPPRPSASTTALAARMRRPGREAA